MVKNSQTANNPLHVAIIMDGNRRWAKANLYDYSYTYEYAIKAVKQAIFTSIENNIKFLSLFAFSVENKKRSKAEIKILISLMKKFLKEESQTLIDNNIKLNIIGDYYGFHASLAKQLDDLMAVTKNNTGLTLNIALNYSGKYDLIQAFNNILQHHAHISQVNEKIITENLFTHTMKDPDILIRTGGEKRISNFFLWQLAYTELFFLDIMWPEFNEKYFLNILQEYNSRERRYGK